MKFILDLIGLVIVGGIVGGLGMLLVPGDQDLAIWKTVLLGIVASTVGGMVIMSVMEDPGFFSKFITAVVLALVLVLVGTRAGLITTKKSA